MSKLKKLITEIHRRSLWQVLLIYVGGSWACYELIDTITSRFGLPEWLPALAVVLFLLGLPFVVATALVRVDLAPSHEATEADIQRAEVGDAAARREARRRHRLLTWRNAAASFVVALAVWGIVATGWIVLHEPEVAPSSENKSVAVLPFVNMNADPTTEWFSDGMAEDIITQLSKIADLKVISRTSVMVYKDRAETPLRQIAAELGVSTVLEGSVRQADNRIRITAQLIDAESDAHVWAETYDRQLSDVFLIQSDVAQKIARALRATLTAGQKELIQRAPTEDLEAYRLYLQGRYFWNRRTEQNFWTAIDFFERAIEKDSAYALAYAGLADCYNLLVDYGHLPPRDGNSRAKAAALRALELDSSFAEAHTALAWISAYFDYNLAAARGSYRQAVELNPSYATAFQWYANTYRDTGSFDDALELMRHAISLDPLSLIINRALGRVFIVGRQYDRAIEQLRRTLEMDPKFVPAISSLGTAYLLQSRYEDAISAFETAVELTNGAPNNLSDLAQAYALSGQEAEARGIIERLDDVSTERYVDPMAIADIYVALRDKDQAYYWLARAYEERSPGVVSVIAWPTYDHIRLDPRYVELTRKLEYQQD